ncbi:MAG: hypothetical protein ACI828_001256 [Flavobacteriales bacterium]|jgi:hypothetical protein
MKNVYWILAIIMMTSCDKASEKTGVLESSNSERSLKGVVSDTNSETQAFLNIQKQERYQKDIIITKTFTKEEGQLSLYYKYPHLNEGLNPMWISFNRFIDDTYINTTDSVEKVLKNNLLSCDPLSDKANRVKRGIDYKVYTKNDQFLSVLLYKANYYDEEDHNSFMFKVLNYDLMKGDFIAHQDIFKEDSDAFLLVKLNQELNARIADQDSFKDCWNFTEDTFVSFRNNFVINEEHVKFYFDDCAVCPTYSGNYFLEIPIGELSEVLKHERLVTMFSTL